MKIFGVALLGFATLSFFKSFFKKIRDFLGFLAKFKETFKRNVKKFKNHWFLFGMKRGRKGEEMAKKV